jgi:hypothetical protein
MKSPRSSSPGNEVAAGVAWYREPWPWIIIAGPLAVVIACMATTVIAVRSDDGMVAENYYKRGLLVNQQLPKGGVVTAQVAATVALAAGGELKVHPETGNPQGDFLRVNLSHPQSGAGEALALRRKRRRRFRGNACATARGPLDRRGRVVGLAAADDRRSSAGRRVRVATSPSIR